MAWPHQAFLCDATGWLQGWISVAWVKFGRLGPCFIQLDHLTRSNCHATLTQWHTTVQSGCVASDKNDWCGLGFKAMDPQCDLQFVSNTDYFFNSSCWPIYFIIQGGRVKSLVSNCPASSQPHNLIMYQHKYTIHTQLHTHTVTFSWYVSAMCV